MDGCLAGLCAQLWREALGPFPFSFVQLDGLQLLQRGTPNFIHRTMVGGGGWPAQLEQITPPTRLGIVHHAHRLLHGLAAQQKWSPPARVETTPAWSGCSVGAGPCRFAPQTWALCLTQRLTHRGPRGCPWPLWSVGSTSTFHILTPFHSRPLETWTVPHCSMWRTQSWPTGLSWKVVGRSGQVPPLRARGLRPPGWRHRNEARLEKLK